MGAENILIDNRILAEPAKIVIAAERSRSNYCENAISITRLSRLSTSSLFAPKMSSSFVHKSLKSQIADLSDPTPKGAQPTLVPKKPAKLVLTCATDYDPEDLEHRNPFDSGSDDKEDLADSDDAREHYTPVG